MKFDYIRNKEIKQLMSCCCHLSSVFIKQYTITHSYQGSQM